MRPLRKFAKGDLTAGLGDLGLEKMERHPGRAAGAAWGRTQEVRSGTAASVASSKFFGGYKSSTPGVCPVAGGLMIKKE
jgi:hypothetical protein